MYNFSLSPSSKLLYGHPALVVPLVSGQTSACILKHLHALLYHSRSFKYILLILLHSLCVPLCNDYFHPFDTLALALRASVQQLLSLSILLANITGLMPDNSSSCLDILHQSI
ncbi:hypothetical protein Acr_05g0012720 [Actinidia rufa]|uniref:Uncharacterized protein n=1 Tax=Actinidia rufa TaxID=165716 RepID=A0A7J0EMC6_9ERIC|nr:hypothetical protein Acr_05g0012720 [Actinidia rufa]